MKMMRKMILYMMLFLNIAIYGQRSYKITFDKNDFEFEQNEVLEIIPKSPDYFLMEDTLQPALPYTSRNILIPSHSKVKDFSVDVKKEIIMKNVLIIPNPKVFPTNSQNISKDPTQPIYLEKKYPEESVVFTTENKMKGYFFAGFVISPFIYDAALKELLFITEITITVQTGSYTEKLNHDAVPIDVKEDLKHLIINPEEIDELYSANKLRSSNSEMVEYLVITSNGLVEYFNPLIAWKIQKGIRSKILSLNEIYSNYNGVTDQLKIKNCLKDYYENYQLKWVLLGGDNTVVPVQGCYGNCSGYIDETMPCDLFYACFDNAFDWNANGNNIIGELDDNVDLNPEIYISRLPIRTDEQITAFVNKLLKYEKQPPVSNYANRMLLTGTKLWNIWNGQSDAHQWSEKMYNDYIANAWSGTKSRFYDTGTDFSGDASYDLNSANLQTQINNGYHFLHMATHGSNTVWSMETGSGYNSTNASNLQNENASIILTMACYTNAFDQSSDPCLSEAFIRNPNGASIAYWGSSRYGWGSPGSSAGGSSFLYDAYFYDQLFKGIPASDNYKFAAVTSTTKQRLVNSSNYYGSYRWLQYTLNAIGDPEMPIYTDNPLSFINPTISQSGTDIIVNTGGISECTIALTSTDYGESYFEVVHNASSHTFSNVTVPCHITISKHNYIPYLACATSAFDFSNQTVTNDMTITNCGDINVQNVTVTNGAKLTLDAAGTTTINSNFEVQLGSELEIK